MEQGTLCSAGKHINWNWMEHFQDLLYLLSASLYDASVVKPNDVSLPHLSFFFFYTLFTSCFIFHFCCQENFIATFSEGKFNELPSVKRVGIIDVHFQHFYHCTRFGTCLDTWTVLQKQCDFEFLLKQQGLWLQPKSQRIRNSLEQNLIGKSHMTNQRQ